MSSFTDALHLKVHTGNLAERPFELLEAFRYWSTIGASEAEPRWITVPAGYRTDFAPIPRLVWPLLPPVGRIGKAADIFNEAMAVLGEPAWRRAIMVWAVNWFGPKFRAGTRPERRTVARKT